MKNPSRVLNPDETAFYMNPRSGKVLAKKGSKLVYLAGANDEKENITILLTANASGQIAPPMIVYRYKRIPLQIAEAVPMDWAIGRSEKGATNLLCSVLQLPLQEVPETFYNNQRDNNHISASENIITGTLAPENVAEPFDDNNAAEPLANSTQQKEQRSDISIAEPGASGLQLKIVILGLSPNKENNTNYSQKSMNTVDPTIPSPFKLVLFWPEIKPHTAERMKREKIPTVLTSSQTVTYYRKKEEDMQQKAEKQAKKKEEREPK
ncbi:hypothetical protein JTB14_022359 [Gonioctena quinquepunctata]|nr:hypothetical protein JTB14_022359 [Gonioctena quinquepunctata]